MKWLPYFEITLVSPYTPALLMEKLRAVSQEADGSHRKTDYLFHGSLSKQDFCLVRSLRQANTFVPLMKGKIEPTKQGSILFLRFELFGSTKVLLALWTILPFLFFVFNVSADGNLFYGMVGLGFSLFNYGIALANFHRQVRISLRLLDRLFSPPTAQ